MDPSSNSKPPTPPPPPSSSSDSKSNFLFITQTPKMFNTRKLPGRRVRASGDKAKNAHVQQGYWQAKKNASLRKLKWTKPVLVRDARGLRLSSKSRSRSPNPNPMEAETEETAGKRPDVLELELDPNQLGQIPPSPKMGYGGNGNGKGKGKVRGCATTPPRTSYAFIQEYSPTALATEPEPEVLPLTEIEEIPWSNRPSSPVRTSDIYRFQSLSPLARVGLVRYSRSPKTPLDTSLIDPFSTALTPISKDINMDIKHCTWFCGQHFLLF
jgi:hypothetical protein